MNRKTKTNEQLVSGKQKSEITSNRGKTETKFFMENEQENKNMVTCMENRQENKRKTET